MALERALCECDLSADDYDSVDVLDPMTHQSLANWGSPTVLVNGHDVTGQPQGDAVGCRIYDTAEHVPTAATIATAIRNGFAS